MALVRRHLPSLPRLGFAPRLLIVLALTLVAAGAVGVWAMSASLRGDLERRGVDALRADAASLARVPELISGEDEDLLAEAREVMDVIEGRPGVERAAVVDMAGVVWATGDRRRVGTRVRDRGTVEALERDRAVVERQRDGDFKYAMPVKLGTRRYALTLEEDGGAFETQLAKIRRDLLVVIGGALGGGFLLFWLIGGRALVATHRDALRRATRDALTGIGNHRAFHEELGRAAAMGGRHGEPVALLLLDLDDLKFVNDRHGHGRGDQLLRDVGRHAEAHLRFEDRAFRTGGDEFAIILPRTGECQAETVAQRLLTALRESGISASAGVSVLDVATPDVVVLREEADAALYEAKRIGRGRHVTFSSIRARTPVVTADKRAALARLLERSQIDVAFQPIWDLSRGTLLGVEALARPAADLGFAGPAEAFDIAQHTGQLFELDGLCARSAIRAARELPDDVALFLNLTPQSIDAGDEMISTLLDEVSAAGLRPDQIVIEVTERLGARAEAVVRGVRGLRNHGFRLALDDVGAGNSGLQTLRQLSLDFVKVDRSICVAAPADEAARAVLQAINAYARETGAFVIVEGIEDDEMLRALQKLHQQPPSAAIRGGQGFGLGRPAPSLAAALDVAAAAAAA